MLASRRVLRNLEAERNRRPVSDRPRRDPRASREGTRRTAGPSRLGEAEQEHACWDPKDGELCLRRTKPEETLVEVRSDSDVQIDRQTWV
jgi:hypothetical protein